MLLSQNYPYFSLVNTAEHDWAMTTLTLDFDVSPTLKALIPKAFWRNETLLTVTLTLLRVT